MDSKSDNPVNILLKNRYSDNGVNIMMRSLPDKKVVEIEIKAKEMLQFVFGDITELNLPIRLTEVLDKYKLRLKSGHFDINGGEEISGAFDRNVKTIYVSSSDNFPRQKFTIAHELGHFILHDIAREIFFRHQVTDLEGERGEEAEANAFAAALLMPDSLVRRYCKITHNIDDLVKIFGVSFTAMHYRLKNLGILDQIDDHR